MRKPMILLIGPSGSGKTATAEYLEKKYSLHAIASYTTRSPRHEGEAGHLFITDQEFDELKDVVAYTVFNGFRYGVTANQIDQGDVYVVDIPGAQTLQENYKGNKEFIVVYLDVPSPMCIQRMTARGDGGLEIASRIKNDEIAFSDWQTRLAQFYDKVYPLKPDTIEHIGDLVWEILQQNSQDQTCGPAITLHTTGCPICKTVKAALDKAGIVYKTNSDIEVMRHLGISSVPVLQVDDALLNAKEAFDYIKNYSGN